jgi:hypothetical protein
VAARSAPAVRIALAALLLLVTMSVGGGSAGAGVSLGDWVKILAGGKTRCARGGAYSYWLRKGDPARLLVFFQQFGWVNTFRASSASGIVASRWSSS